MLDKLTKKIMDSFHRNAHETITPIKEAVKHNVNTQINLGSGLLKFTTMILLFFGVLKMGDGPKEAANKELPGTIIINNYIHEREAEGRE